MQRIFEFSQYLPTVVCTTLLIVGLYSIFLRDLKTTEIWSTVRGKLREESETDKYFRQAGIRLNAASYRLLTRLVAGIFIAYATVSGIKTGHYGYIALGIIFVALFLWASRPVEYAFGTRTSPFVYIMKRLIRSQGVKYDRELFNSCITLKNLAIVKEEAPISADLVFENLMNNAQALKPIYAAMISIYRSDSPEMAFRYFAETVDTKAGKSFASTLSRIDKINPFELKEQVHVMQEMMSEQRLTQGLGKAERNGMITTMLASAVVFAMMLNFAFVVVMMDALNMLQNIF